jgi:hypothetical protein
MAADLFAQLTGSRTSDSSRTSDPNKRLMQKAFVLH